MSKLKSLIGTKKFYKTVIAIALPVMLQQGITSFVSILDNLMVGQLDTISFDAVAIVNQILFIINIVIIKVIIFFIIPTVFLFCCFIMNSFG